MQPNDSIKARHAALLAEAQTQADADREKQRVAFLEKHHALLRQKLQNETEQCEHDAQQDESELAKRQQELFAYGYHHHDNPSKQQPQQHQLVTALAGGSPTTSLHHHHHLHLHEFTYKKVDDLDLLALKKIASLPELQHEDAKCLQNVAGKYHTRYIRNGFPIAGSQIKLERERELYVNARKKLLYLKDQVHHAPRPSPEVTQQDQQQHNRHRMLLSRMQHERRMNLFVNKMVDVLKHESHQVEQDQIQRRFDFVEAKEPAKTRVFWEFLHENKTREALLWLKANEFVDVNVPMMYNTPLKNHHSTNEFLSSSCSSKQSTKTKRTTPPSMWLMSHEVGLTPLMVACQMLSYEMVQALLEQNAQVDLQNANGESAVHFIYKDWWHKQQLPPTVMDSAASDFTKPGKHAPGGASAGANGSKMSMQEATALMVKCRQAQDILQLLHDHGANLFGVTGFGQTVFHFIAYIGFLPTCVFLLELYARYQDEQVAKAKLHGLADGFQVPDAKDRVDRSGKTPLDLAIQNHHVDLARLLQNFSILHKTKLKEHEWARTKKLLQTRGKLSLEWSLPREFVALSSLFL